MLTHMDELDEINSLLCRSNGWVALDINNGNYLIRNTRPEHGKREKYIYCVRNAMTIVIWAASDREAIEKINHSKFS